MEYMLLICGLALGTGIGIGAVIAFEIDRELDFDQKIKDKRQYPPI